jgi:DNA polymerase-3 subunit epsilon
LLLRREFIRIGLDFEYNTSDIIDTKKIYEHLAPRTLRSAYHYYFHKYLKLDHSAIFNTETAADILLKQLDEYKEIRNKDFINKLHETTEEELLTGSTQKFYWVVGEAYFSFSKYKNKSLSWVAKKDPKFLEWMLQSDFSKNTKNIIKNAIKK